ncbi:hypothetical protein HK099_007566 [Clydaea vesicula]|uniref:Uncharacterized protein n=1 Tax=Clydaea vesicula TaxID=447962 RepID=A0AAD5TWZ2_9FUNG|nr:hypothetical protein HK099_007566 [Clydaea vesicula]
MKKRKVEDDKEINQVFMRVTRSKAANQDDGSVKTKSVLPSKAKKKISQKIEKNEIKEEVKEEIEEENEEDMEVEKKLEAEKKLEEEKTKGKKEEEEEESKKLDLDEKKESNKKLGEVTGGSSTAAAKSVNFLIESANTCSTYKGHQKRISI